MRLPLPDVRLVALTALLALAARSIAQEWVVISDAAVAEAAKEDKKANSFEKETAGVAVDPKTGDVYMIVNRRGVWKSTDAGKSFVRVDGGKVSGRCETSFALNADPAGGRLACFMLDGKCAWTGDGGKTWEQMKDVGRNWDYAAVDWSSADIRNIFAGLHESGGQTLTSVDGGKTWTKLFKQKEFDRWGGLGIFDAKTLVYTEKGKGIQRSTDGGATWTKVSEVEPIGRVVTVLKGTAYWLGKEGLVVSKDQGQTWKVQGKPVAASIGPWVDPKNEKRIAAAGQKGVFRTDDGGETWTQVTAALPKGFQMPREGWYANVAWDPVRDVFYASQMGKPTYRLERGK
jgi:photosystem II stability/assembly factor-like uncharacterized protein